MRSALLLPLLFVACQSTPRYQLPNGAPALLTLEVQASFDAVWQAVIEQFATSMTAIETIEKASGFVAAARSVDCTGIEDLAALVDLGMLDGAWATARVEAQPERSSVRVRYNVFVTRGDAQQLVRVNTAWTGWTMVKYRGKEASFQVALTGNSKGVFERLLLEAIASNLPGAMSEIKEAQPFRPSTFDPPPRDLREDQGVHRIRGGRS